jgi:hypothetical protein
VWLVGNDRNSPTLRAAGRGAKSGVGQIRVSALRKAALGVSVLGLVLSIFNARQAVDRHVDSRTTEAITALRNAGKALDELEVDLSSRKQRLDVLQAQLHDAEELEKLTAAQRDALIRTISGSLRPKSPWPGRLITAAWTVFGAALGAALSQIASEYRGRSRNSRPVVGADSSA